MYELYFSIKLLRRLAGYRRHCHADGGEYAPESMGLSLEASARCPSDK
jgi:hypothetical protein